MFVKKLAYLMVVVAVCLFGIGCIAATGLPGSAVKGPGGHQTGDVFTSSFLVRFKRSLDKQLVHEIASRNGFQNLGELPGSNGKEFHFKHTTLPLVRTRRSISHTRVLKKEPLVSMQRYENTVALRVKRCIPGGNQVVVYGGAVKELQG
uniref:Peptidase S8 pro-domain domain-containing protein n=1 Tax=Anopheles melas TaxID=34690 RepID=A0A182TDY9_9DIPT